MEKRCVIVTKEDFVAIFKKCRCWTRFMNADMSVDITYCGKSIAYIVSDLEKLGLSDTVIGIIMRDSYCAEGKHTIKITREILFRLYKSVTSIDLKHSVDYFYKCDRTFIFILLDKVSSIN